LNGGMSSNDLVVDLSVCEVANMCAVSFSTKNVIYVVFTLRIKNIIKRFHCTQFFVESKGQ